MSSLTESYEDATPGHVPETPQNGRADAAGPDPLPPADAITAHQIWLMAHRKIKAPKRLTLIMPAYAPLVSRLERPAPEGTDLKDDVRRQFEVVVEFLATHEPDDARRQRLLQVILTAVEEPRGVFPGFTGSFPKVREFSSALRPVPKLDPKLLPNAIRPWLVDIAERACCPLDMPAAGAIVALGSAIGRRVGIRPKRLDDWLVVPNHWGMVVMPPGWLKSHCLEEATKPLVRLEAAARKAHETATSDFEVTKAVKAAQAKAAKAALESAAKGKKPGTEAELRALAEAALAEDGATPPTMVRHVINDATPEKTGELLAENPAGLLQYRDELTGFLRTLEKQGYESARAFYLEGWNGTSRSFVFDRIGRGTTFSALTLSVLGGIQPGKLAAYIRDSASGENDDGLIPRFQVAVYPDTDLPFVNVDSKPNGDARDKAQKVFAFLARLDRAKAGADLEDWDPDGIPFLHFAEDAQEFFDGWRAELEGRIRNKDEKDYILTHLSKYRSLMPSLALEFHLVEVACGRPKGPVPLRDARRAAAWCAYLEEHARRIYQAALEDDMPAALRLGGRLRSLQGPFTVGDVVKKEWEGLGYSGAVKRALAILEDYGWVVREDVPPGPKGGRPGVRYHVNPGIPEEES